jgi:hypothetical protein
MEIPNTGNAKKYPYRISHFSLTVNSSGRGQKGPAEGRESMALLVARGWFRVRVRSFLGWSIRREKSRLTLELDGGHPRLAPCLLWTACSKVTSRLPPTNWGQGLRRRSLWSRATDIGSSPLRGVTLDNLIRITAREYS